MRRFGRCFNPGPVVALVVWLLGAGASPGWAQEAGPAGEDVAALVAEIQGALAEAKDDPGVAAEATAEPVRTLRAALEAAQGAGRSLVSAGEFTARANAAPETLAQIEAELARPVEAFVPTIAPGATLADLERELAQAEADLKAARTELDNILAEIPRRNDRLKAIPDEIAALTSQIEALQQQLALTPSPDLDASLANAQRLRSRAELAAARSRIAELQAETASYDVRRDLLPARRDRAARKAAAAEERFSEWQRVVNARRTAEADQAAREASAEKLALARGIGPLQPIARDIEKLKELLTGDDSAPKLLPGAAADLADRTASQRKIDELDRAVRRRVGAGGLDSSQGQFLRRQLNQLSSFGAPRQLHVRLGEYRDRAERAQLELIELDELEAESSDVERALAGVRSGLGPEADGATIALATDLLTQRRMLVRQALDAYQSYSETLDSLLAAYARAIESSERIREFINERVFWVRSVPGPLVPSAADLAEEARWFASPEDWALAARRGADTLYPSLARLDADRSPGEGPSVVRLMVAPGGGALLLFVALAGRWRLGQRSGGALPKTGRVSQSSMLGAVWKLSLAVMAAGTVPLALWVLSRWLGASAGAMTAPEAVATGLDRAAHVLFGIGLLGELSRAGAVGAEHFRWSEAGLAHLRRELRWFAPIAVAAALMNQTFNFRSEQMGLSGAGGRAAFVGVMLTAAVFYSRVFSPSRPLIAEYMKKHRGGVVERTRLVWFPLMVTLPVLLALATIAGYAYTALQIQRRLGDTFVFVLVVIVGSALVLRYSLLARRKLAVRAAEARAAAAQAGGGESKDAVPEIDASAEIDLTAVSLQTRKVVQALVTVVLIVGLYGVWTDVLPALRWFERVQVFPQVAYVNPDVESVSATPPAAPPEAAPQTGLPAPAGGTGVPGPGAPPVAGSVAPGAGARSVTLADLGLAVLVLMLTVSASANVPGLLEITVLRRLPLGAAGRYAIYTVARYLIVFIGIVAISQTLSVPWEKAQWLAAALTFGLAFGLQEIFANFVSGLIILFEQPVRLGDTVTIGGSSGTVTKIRMRATTIKDWDNKELVIPNKTFITDQITNWTLSDPVCRVVVPIGIAYGSDTELARDILLRVARESEHTLAEPPARALFLGFGESSLDLELRFFIDHLDNMVATRSDVLFRVDSEFRRAGIEIAFPQRDVHVRSIDRSIVEGLSAREAPTRTTAGGSS